VEALYALFLLDNVLFSFGVGFTTYLNRIVRKGELTPCVAMGTTMNHIAAVTVPFGGAWLWERFHNYQIPFWVGVVHCGHISVRHALAATWPGAPNERLRQRNAGCRDNGTHRCHCRRTRSLITEVTCYDKEYFAALFSRISLLNDKDIIVESASSVCCEYSGNNFLLSAEGGEIYESSSVFKFSALQLTVYLTGRTAQHSPRSEKRPPGA
jgi:hypothetical protein